MYSRPGGRFEGAPTGPRKTRCPAWPQNIRKKKKYQNRAWHPHQPKPKNNKKRFSSDPGQTVCHLRKPGQN